MGNDVAKNKPKNMPLFITKIALRVLLWIVLAWILINALLTMFTPGYLPTFFSYRFFNVVTDSMKGEFDAGTMIISQEVKSESEIAVGDIISYRLTVGGKEHIFSHRVHSITERDGATAYKTKGDNVPVPDSYYVAFKDIVGKYTGASIPMIGALMAFTSSFAGIVCIIIIMFIVFISSGAVELLKASEKREQLYLKAVAKSNLVLNSNLPNITVAQKAKALSIMGILLNNGVEVKKELRKQNDIKIEEYVNSELVDAKEQDQVAVVENKKEETVSVVQENVEKAESGVKEQQVAIRNNQTQQLEDVSIDSNAFLDFKDIDYGMLFEQEQMKMSEIEQKKVETHQETMKQKEQQAIELNCDWIECAKQSNERNKQLYVSEYEKDKRENDIFTLKLQKHENVLFDENQEKAFAGLEKDVSELKEKIENLNNLNKKSMEKQLKIEVSLEEIFENFDMVLTKKKLEFARELAKKDLDVDFKAYTSNYRNEMTKKFAIEEVAKIKSDINKKAEQQKADAVREVVNLKLTSLDFIERTVGRCNSIEELEEDEKNVDEIMKDVENTNLTKVCFEKAQSIKSIIVLRIAEIRRLEKLKADEELRKIQEQKTLEEQAILIAQVEQQEQAILSMTKAETANRLKKAISMKQKELLMIKSLLPKIREKSQAFKVMNKLNQIEATLQDEMKVVQILVPINNLKLALKHLVDIIDLRNNYKRRIAKGIKPKGAKVVAKSSDGTSKSPLKSNVKSANGKKLKNEADSKTKVKAGQIAKLNSKKKSDYPIIKL